ncbi:MAG TPA: hypothetical protein VMZ22_13365 [Acidimicrobiales bacterium]|nr:hypothetical protein [Acidimicrobiales bacterium]
MFAIRKLVLVAVAAGLLAVAPVSPVRAATPVRSGSILGGTGESPVTFGVRGMEGCVGAPGCSAWLQSGCRPALAGKNPTVHASIVNVETLAGTDRLMTARGYGGGGSYIMQFWRPTTATQGSGGDWCVENFQGRLGSWECAPRYAFSPCRLRIPSNAKWMTITASPDHLKLNWKLW